MLYLAKLLLLDKAARGYEGRTLPQATGFTCGYPHRTDHGF
jgi:hypothetical protein